MHRLNFADYAHDNGHDKVDQILDRNHAQRCVDDTHYHTLRPTEDKHYYALHCLADTHYHALLKSFYHCTFRYARVAMTV